MNKTLEVLLLTAGLALHAFGQGTIYFANDTSTYARIGGRRGEDPTAAPIWSGMAQLFAAPPGLSFTPSADGMKGSEFLAANPGWRLVGDPAPIDFHGLFDGGPVTIDFIPQGGAVDVATVVWLLDYFHSLEEALLYSPYNFGSSEVMHFDATGTLANPVPLTQAEGANGAMMFYVPEPSALVLAVLGGGVWLARRRRCTRFS